MSPVKGKHAAIESLTRQCTSKMPSDSFFTTLEASVKSSSSVDWNTCWTKWTELKSFLRKIKNAEDVRDVELTWNEVTVDDHFVKLK